VWKEQRGHDRLFQTFAQRIGNVEHPNLERNVSRVLAALAAKTGSGGQLLGRARLLQAYDYQTSRFTAELEG